MRLEIVVGGHLSSEWSAEFDGLEVTCRADGNTNLSGFLPDQAALYGLLLRLRDFGLTLVSVNPLVLEGNENHETTA